jgi:PST family polysaccharide transporter
MFKPSSRGDLKNRAARGSAVMLTAQMATILLQLASVVVLSRLLPAEDFGLIAMIGAITTFLGLFRDLGLSTASIQKGHLDHAEASLLFWLNVAMGAMLTLLAVAMAPAIAWFYRKPELQPVSILLALTFLISSLGAQHSAVMQRELRFKSKAIGDIGGALASLLTAVPLALMGFRYWAIAWGVIAGALVTTLLYCSLSGFRPAPPRRTAGIGELLGFGADVTAFELINYFHRNLDNILIGRIWGSNALGLYNRAYQIMMLPIASLRAPMNVVALPILSTLQGDPDRFRTYFRRFTSMLAFLSMPMMAFLVVNAQNVVTLVLGEDWIELVPIFVLLGITGFIQPVAGLRGLALLSLGKSRRYMSWGLINAIAVSISFCIGVVWGSVGVAAAYTLCNYLMLYPSLKFVFRDTPLSAVDFFTAIALPACASICAGTANHVVMTHIEPMDSAFHLALALFVFGSSFLLFFLAFPAGREILKSYRDLLRQLHDRSPQIPT